MDGRCMTQTELAEHWQISEATLERWRTEAGGPVFLKLGAQVRYRVRDVEAFEAEVLTQSTKHQQLCRHAQSSHARLSKRPH